MGHAPQGFDRLALQVIGPPYMHILTGENVDLNRICHTLTRDGVVARLLRGRRMRTVDGVWDEFAAAFQFPYYFGHNWAAFDECLADMDWFAPVGFVVGIMDAGALLADELNGLTTLVKLLHKAGETYRQAIALGSSWDREARSFHVVLQERTPEVGQVRQHLLAAGATIADSIPAPH